VNYIKSVFYNYSDKRFVK